MAMLVVVAIAAAAWVTLAGGSADRQPPATGPESSAEKHASRAAKLSVAELAGQRLVTGFAGGSPPDRVRRMISQGNLAGVILFDENLGTRRHARKLIRQLQAIKRPAGLRSPLLVMIDQEGGLVKRLSGPPSASAEEMGRRGRRYSRRQGIETARNLKDVGVNTDLAPVLDVGRPGSAIRAQHRSFGRTAKRVADTAVPFGLALQGRGVAATGKHFPGLGAAKQDTDFAVQKVKLSRRELRRVDERPYVPYARRSRLGLVMLSTAIYTHFSHRPAAFTRKIATGELRHHVGFAGVSITDALQTTSAAHFGGPAKVGVAAAKAGADLLLYTDGGAAARAGHALRERLRKGKLERGRFERSVNRVLRLRAKLGK